MGFLVPYDGSRRAKSALSRARVYAIALEEAPTRIQQELLQDRPLGVLAMSVIPESARYAREKGWIGDDEAFSSREVAAQLHREVLDIDPAADFQHERVDAAATAGTISGRLRRRATADDISVVFIGSENAGRIVTPLSSVGGGVSAGQDYEVHIVRRALPPEVRERVKSEFFLVDD